MTLAQLIPLVIAGSVMLLVFSLGLEASPRDTIYLASRPGLLFRSIFSMNIVMVIFAAAIASLFELDPAIRIAIVALAVSPVPPVLPKKQRRVAGTDPYAIGLLVAAVLFAIVLVPASIKVLGYYFAVDANMPTVSVARIVTMSAIAPLMAGILVHRFAPAFAQRIARPISVLATTLLLAGALPILFTMYGAIWAMIGGGVLLVLTLFVLAGLVTGHLLGGPDPDHRTVLALASCTRHPGIALAIAGLNFPARKTSVMAVILCYLIISGIISFPYKAWRKHRHAAHVSGGAPG